MIGFRLQLKQLPDGRLIFKIPLSYKILLFLIGGLILVSLIITGEEGSGGILVRENTIPLIICFLSFLGAAYRERWIFDRGQDQLIYQHGISALHVNKVYRISDLERIEIAQFVKGKAGSAQPRKRSIAFRPVVSYPVSPNKERQQLPPGELQGFPSYKSGNNGPEDRRVLRNFLHERHSGQRRRLGTPQSP